MKFARLLTPDDWVYAFSSAGVYTQTLCVYTSTCQRDSVACVAEASHLPSHAPVHVEDTNANATGAETRILARRTFGIQQL